MKNAVAGWVKISCFLLAAALAFSSNLAFSQQSMAGEAPRNSVTIYNDNFALVREIRKVRLQEGENEIKVDGVAAKIEPESVHFKPLWGPRAAILEQNFDYDLVSAEKLLATRVGKSVILVDNYTGERSEVTVLSVEKGIAVERDGIVLINPPGWFEAPDGVEDMVVSPTLSWLVDAEREGILEYELSYVTDGMKWNCDYLFTLDTDEKSGTLEGWVTLENNCGISFAGAKLQLVAGDVKREKPKRYYDNFWDYVGGTMSMSIPPPFYVAPLAEYYLYTLPYETSIKNKQVKQLQLLSASGIPVSKRYVFPLDSGVYAEYEIGNFEEHGLGIPLPKGVMRVFWRDSGQIPRFLSKTNLYHTPRKEKVLLMTRRMHDILAIRNTSRTKVKKSAAFFDVTVNVRNQKRNEDVDLIVIQSPFEIPETLPVEFKVIRSNYEFTYADSRTAEFNVYVPANSERELRIAYEVRFLF